MEPRDAQPTLAAQDDPPVKEADHQAMDAVEHDPEMAEALAALVTLELASGEKAIRGALLEALPHRQRLPALETAIPQARARLAAARAAAFAEKEERMCIVCCEREKAMCFVPCGHRAVCAECAGTMQARALNAAAELTCPVCRGVSTSVMRVYG